MNFSQSLVTIEKLDRSIMIGIVKWHHTFLTFFLRMFTNSGKGISWALFSFILYCLNQREIYFLPQQKLFFQALICPLLAFIIGNIIKVIVRRKRPFQAIPNYTSLGGSPFGDSFPSLHAGTSSAFFVGLCLLHHPLAPLVGIWSALVSFSRVYLGVHYPSDIIAGLVLGLICGNLYFLHF